MHNINIGDKRRQTIQRFLIYGMFGVIILVLTFLSMFALLGYDLDRKTGEIIRNGLILVDSYPVEARVFLNSEPEPGKTPKRLAVPAGTHNVRLEADGYRTWELDSKVTAGSVTWLYYPNLIPQNIEKETVNSYTAKPVFELSDSKKHLLIYNPANGNIEFFETNRLESLAAYKLPAEETKISDFQVQDWLTHDRALLSYKVGDKVRAAVIDIADGIKPIATFSTLDKVLFDETRLLFLSDGSLFAVNYQEPEIVLVNIANNIKDFNVYKDSLFVLQQNNQIVDLDAKELFFASDKDINTFSLSDYDSDNYLLTERSNQVALYKDVSAKERPVPLKVIALSRLQDYEFSSTGRYLMVQNENQAVTYNLERGTSFNLDIGSNKDLMWFDDVRYSYVEDGELFVVDFNGKNAYLIGEIAAGTIPALSSNEALLLNLIKASASERYILQASHLTVKN